MHVALSGSFCLFKSEKASFSLHAKLRESSLLKFFLKINSVMSCLNVKKHPLDGSIYMPIQVMALFFLPNSITYFTILILLTIVYCHCYVLSPDYPVLNLLAATAV